ncbi:hypothetical protein FPV67DRAFT_1672061 [Lyophyllum atratum]|nr:hypothetical protein FPV67DRAFT_1672061 [Lyophyllum atratum]
MATSFIYLDDSDTSSKLTYTNGWARSDGGGQYDGTGHRTAVAGAQAIISFTGESMSIFQLFIIFTVRHPGSSIEVYGKIAVQRDSKDTFSAVSSYTIDGDPNSTATFTGIPKSVDQYNQTFYTSPRLSAGKVHTLVITCVALSEDHGLLLDYFRIGQDLDAQPSPSTSQPTSQPISQPTSQPVSQPVSQPTSRPTSQPISQPISQPTSQPTSQLASQPTSLTDPQLSSQSAGLSKGEIGGIVVGSLVALCLAVAVFVLWRRLVVRSRAKGSVQSSSREGPPSDLLQSEQAPYITPFDLNASMSQPSSNSMPRYSYPRQASGTFSDSNPSTDHPPAYTTQGGTYADKGVPYPYTPPLHL